MGSLKLTLAVLLRLSGGGESQGDFTGRRWFGDSDSWGRVSRDLTGSGGGKVEVVAGGASAEVTWFPFEH